MMSFLASYDSAYEAGRLTGIALVAIFGVLVASRFSKGGKVAAAERAGARRAAWMVLGAVLVIGSVVGFMAYRSSGRRQAMDRLMQRMAPLAEEARRKAAAGEVESMAEPMRRMVATLKDFAREEDGSDGGLFAVCFAQSVETILPAAERYDATVMAFMDMGAWDASSVAQKKDAAKRLAVLPKAIEANRDLLQGLKLLSGTVRQQLGAAGFDEMRSSAAADGFLRGANITRAIREHEIEDELLGLAQAQLRVLRDYPSAWRARGMRAEFTGEIPPEAMNTYTEAANRCDKLLRDVEALMTAGG